MRKGFTLVELLIVLAVIAALMSVATPLALNAVKNAKASQVAQNFRNIKAAFENAWNTERGKINNVDLTTNGGTLKLSDLQAAGYLSSVPSGFSDITVSAPSNGVYTVYFTYDNTDVDVDRVVTQYADVKKEGTKAKLEFSVQKFW